MSRGLLGYRPSQHPSFSLLSVPHILSFWNRPSQEVGTWDRHLAKACQPRAAVPDTMMLKWTHDPGRAQRVPFWDIYHIHRNEVFSFL